MGKFLSSVVKFTNMISQEKSQLETIRSPEKEIMDKFFSSVVKFTQMISQEKFPLETIRMEVLLIYKELSAIRLEYVDKEADKENAERPHYLKLKKAIHKAEATIVDNVLRTARCEGRKPPFKRYACCKDFGAREFSRQNIIISISKSIKEFKDYLEGSSMYYSRRESFNLLDLMRSSVDFDEVEEDLNIVGDLRQAMESLKAQLRGDSHSRVISVLGIKGIGKTTLARKIYKSRFVEANFQCKAWFCVSAMNNDDLSEIVKAIHEQINEFPTDRSYLLVLDDVYDLQIWRKLQEGISKGNCGSRIILTTHDVQVASFTDYTHRLKVLSKEESWELLMKVFRAPLQIGNASSKDTTESLIHLPQELDSLGKEMVGKCGGIPYLIIELANLLTTVNADPVEWSCILHGTNTHLSSNQHPWFNLASYVNHILPLHVKQFLHFTPTTTEIPLRRFIRSLSAECLWQLSNSGIFNEEEATRQLLQDLQDLNLIEAEKVSSIGTIKTFRIPLNPLIQILKAVSSPENTMAWIHGFVYDCNAPDSLSHCFPIGINSAEELEPYKTLRSFWCFNFTGGYKPGHETGIFLMRYIDIYHLWFLRVLDLEGVYKPRLPEAIGELINLQYLGLRWTFLDTLPLSVKNLWNLQTLDTKHTNIVNYPMIWYMQKLKHLYLNKWHSSKLLTQLGYVSNLETLSGVTIDDSSPVKGGLDKLTNLRKLKMKLCFSQQQRMDAFYQWIQKMKDIQTLKIKSKQLQTSDLLSLSFEKKKLSCVYLKGESKISSNNDFSSGLTTLTLSLTKLKTDPMPTLGKLPELKLLSLFSKSFIGCCMHCLPKSFPRLRVLKIWKLEELAQWTVDYSAFPKLEELEIRSCENLQMLPDCVPISLRELKLTDMPMDFTSNVMGKDSEKVAHVCSVLIDYRSDLLINCSIVELYTGWNRVMSQGQLEKLFGVDLFPVNVVELTLSETKLEEDPMPLLEKLPQLVVLILSFKSYTGNHMVCKKGGFKELQELIIQELEELEELTIEDGAMPRIEELEIRSCRKLKVLTQVPETLEELKLAKIPKEFTEKYRADKRVIIED